MLNITVFCGGTGSIALQNGLNDVFGYGKYNLNVIINAYDNGKSTGVCRRAFHNKILGPSDLRKNQLTAFKIKHKKYLDGDDYSYYKNLYDLFNLRISADSPEEYADKAVKIISSSKFLYERDYGIMFELKKYVNDFFYDKNNVKEWLKNESFNDFSLSNIFYAQCAAENYNSLGVAGTRMANILEIDDNVHLISDISLMLKAKTESGHIIEDEGEIVDWKNPNDKIASNFFINPETGEEYIPTVDEGNPENKVRTIIENSDVIIFSSGTQWSSLIPTYIHSGFYEIIKNCKAKKYLVMNNVQDKDMYGVNSSDVAAILRAFLPIDDITIVFNENACPEMKCTDGCKFIIGKLSKNGQKTHDSVQLIRCIFNDYFFLKKGDTIISDLDGTIIDSRGNEEIRKLGKENVKLFNGIIITGNMENHVRNNVEFHPGLDIYCDYGLRHIVGNKSEFISTSIDVFLEEKLIEEISNHPDFTGKVINRNGLMLSIKPLYNRKHYKKVVDKILEKYNGNYKAVIAGSTTIDIMNTSYNKMISLLEIINLNNLNYSDILYVGNEMKDIDGNDYCIKMLGIRTFNVNGIEEFNNIMKLNNVE